MMHITYISWTQARELHYVRGRGIDLRMSQRLRAGDVYTAEDEPTDVSFPQIYYRSV